MIISIDSGNKNIKTENFVFPTALYSTDISIAGSGNELFYNGEYYTATGDRIPFRRDKTEDERHFILALIGIAKELDKKIADGKIKEDARKNFRITLLNGLPPRHLKLKDKFTEYFKTDKPVAFSYNGVDYKIKIDNVYVFPQALAAAFTTRKELFKEDELVVIDIGGYTVDYMLLRKGVLDPSKCKTIERGVNKMYDEISEECVNSLELHFSEDQLDKIIQTGKTRVRGEAGEKAKNLIVKKSREFANDIIAHVTEIGVDFRTTPIMFVGGGSKLLSKYFDENTKIDAMYNDDICANAKGYKALYNLYKK